MTDQENDTQNEQTRDEDGHALTWLQRIVLRLGGERRGDVVAAYIGPGARNVIVGKNNIQIVAGERNLVIPIMGIVLMLVVIAGLLAYPLAKPRLFPEKMTGRTNIAIAEIGGLGALGGVRSHRLGATLRDSIHRDLEAKLQEYFPEWMEDGTIQLRHDLGPIKGRSPEQRQRNAARLTGVGRRSINATLVVYGYIFNQRDDQDGEWTLQLEFYYMSPTVRQEPDAVTGRYVLADAIQLSGDPEQDPEGWAWDVNRLLGPRMRALSLITLGLIQDAIDDHKAALKTFESAKNDAELAAWNARDGKGILHFFVGRQALFLRDYDLAITELNKALDVYQDFANAQHTLGAVYFDMAQLYFSFDDEEEVEIPAGQTICFDRDQVIETKARFKDEAEAWDTLWTSQETSRKAITTSQQLEWPHVEHVARLTLGLANQLEAQAHLYRDGSTTAADEKLAEAEAQFKLALEGFTADNHPQYIGWSHLGLGLVQDNRADLLFRQNEETFAVGNEQAVAVLQAMSARLTDAIRHYDECRKQKAFVIIDRHFTNKVITCGCEYYGDRADEYRQRLRAYMDELGGELAGN